ncbi:MAG: tryptophan synthase subunit alpha [Patescibacteria group bacterium]
MKLMTHVVVGYPNLRETERIVAALAQHSDIIELQIPFSDPVADGPVIMEANDVAVQGGITPDKCLAFAKKITKKHPETKFYFMSYFNPIYRAGIAQFVKAAARNGIKGFIVPDLPVEEAQEFLKECRRNKLNFVFVVAPNTSKERLKKIVRQARGLIYCVARLGVTGKQSSFGVELKKFLKRIKKLSGLPLAVGFGIMKKADLAAIRSSGGDIAVIGSEIIRQHKKGGAAKVEKFIKSLI